jgi:hypothetical protein
LPEEEDEAESDERDEEKLLLAEDTVLEMSEPTLSAPVDALEPAELASVDRSEPTFLRSSLVLLEQAGVLMRRTAPSKLAAAMRRDLLGMVWRYPHAPSGRPAGERCD